jgi:hypothetical protein
MHRLTVLLALLSWALMKAPNARAESTEERFHDLFITAGYATAFGAALGAAALSFSSAPEQNLKFVAVGASLGFFGGSALGTYLIFSPMFTDTAAPNDQRLATIELPKRGLVIRPVLSRDLSLARLETGLTILQF